MAIFGNIITELKQVPKDDKANDYADLEVPEDAAGDATSEEPDTPEGDGDYELPDEEPEEDTGEEGDGDYDLPEDEEPEEDLEGEEPPPEDEGDGNYELDGEEDAGEEDTGEEPTDEEPAEDTSGDNELQDKENQLFADMSNVQKSIKDKELVTNYIGLYNLVDSIHEKLERVPKTDETINVVEFTSRKTEEIKMLIQKYVSDTYATKTYLENLTNYYQFIAAVKKIERGLATIERKKDDENDET